MKSYGRPLLTVLLPLVLTLAVTGVLGWSAWKARQEHRHTAEQTARDYARFAAAITASHVEAAMRQVLQYAFYGADLAERQGSTDPVLPRTLATNPAEADRCDSHYPHGRWFVRVAPDGRMDVEGPLDPDLGRWVADTLVALQRRPSSASGNLYPPGPDGGLVAYRVRRRDGRPVEAHALAHCFEARDGSVFDAARTRGPLLPPTVAGADSLVIISVRDPRGDVVYRSGTASEPNFSGVRPAEASGPIEGLTFTAAVPASLAEALVAGGIPAGRSYAVWLLLLSAAGLGAATYVQLRRSVALVRARERFVANVSHELRTPLQLVLLFAQLLRLDRMGSSRERHEAVGVIERETQRLIGLVERVLAFAGTGTPAVEPFERIDLSEVAGDTVEAFRLMAASEGVVLEAELPRELPRVRGNAGTVRQVLVDLLDNAMRYGPPGQRVVVRTRSANGLVELIVDDEGPGIPPTERELVWQPFHRLEGSERGGKAGSGIGLAVVRDSVESMDGRTWIEDAPGGGARVIVAFPVDGSNEQGS